MSKELTAHHSNSIEVAESIQLGNSPDSLSPAVVLSLAKKAMMATRKAALLAQKSNILSAVLDEQHFSGLVSQY